MFTTAQLILYTQWLGYFTLFCAALTVLGWILKWGIRFRLVGITSFMGVLTGGLFALSLGLYTRPSIPDAVRFTRVYDTGAAQVVIAVPPTITATQLEATLRQAAIDLYSPGRLSQGGLNMVIRARALTHPEPGITRPLYLGQVTQSLASRNDENLQIEIFPDQLAQLPQPNA